MDKTKRKTAIRDIAGVRRQTENKKIIAYLDNRQLDRDEQNYKILKLWIIEVQQQRQGTWSIDFEEASDLAWSLAERLPGDVAIEMDDPDPDWLGMIVFVTVMLAFIAMLIVVFS